jgi:diguanylate cyclase (GGDEF)-like protein/PAS domain S-box-containing protein
MQDAPALILTIDDDLTVRENIVAYLEDSGFEVCQAENGALGLEVFRARQPDLVLVDLRMPVMDGMEVVRRMKIEAPAVPVIVVSGVGVLEEAVEALRIGAWDFVTKPITDMMVLEHAVGKALERARLLEERNRYQDRLEQEVSMRTSELRNANARLLEVQAQLQEKNQFLETLIESIPNPIFYKDLTGVYLGCNKVFSDMLGVRQEDVVGQSSHRLLPDEVACRMSEIDSQDGMLTNCLMELAAPDGALHNFVLYKSFFFDRDGQRSGEVGTFHDITELKRKEAQITYQAHHDELTGLPNCLKIKQEIAALISRYAESNLQFAVLFLDLDNFKTVNDSLGHKVGDRLLTETAERLLALTGERGMVARLGGDEYVVLLPHIMDETEAGHWAETVLNAFRNPFMISEHELYLSTSIGVTCYPKDGADPDTLIKNADIAMYRAKARERSSWQRFDIAMVEQVTKRLAIEKDIRKGLENNEFIPYYQPRVDIRTGKVVGMEALVRWHKADGTVGNPGEFIPVAEETGLIVQLGERVLREACRQTRIWHSSGMDGLRVSVNISAHQFRANLVDMVFNALDESGIDPELLELEITESTMMSDLGQTVSLLERLAGRGILTAIDDFGTGHSSLYYLKTFHINTLKIDRSFVEDILNDENDANIVSTVISMAKNLSLQVVAEGVETQEQLDRLREYGCPEVQGFFYSRPVPAVDFEIYVRKTNGW